MTEVPGENPDDEKNHNDDETNNPKDTFGRLTEEYEDAATTELFQSQLPMRKLPPEFADRLKADVLKQVNETLKSPGEPTDNEIDAEFYEIMNRGETTTSPDQPNQESGEPSAESQNTFPQRIRGALRRVMGLFNKS